jgi:hypothetical protein
MRILSILSLLLLLFPILSENVCIIVYLDLFCEGSTHFHKEVKQDKFRFVEMASGDKQKLGGKVKGCSLNLGEFFFFSLGPICTS